MKDKYLYACWAGMFILCAGLGFIPAPENGVKGLLILAAVAFFAPGGMLLYRGQKAGDRKAVRRVRTVSLAALAAALVLLVANFLSVGLPAWAGNVLYGLLVVVTAPMVCGQYYVLSLFLWSCLLTASLSALGRMKKVSPAPSDQK